jgi:hypothetical protein
MAVVSSCAAFPSTFSTRVASLSPEYRAAASLRAQSFYSCPPERSDYARMSYLRMKTEEIWHNIEDSVLHSKETLVYPMISTVVLKRGKQNSLNFADLSVCLPGDVSLCIPFPRR